MKRALIIVAAIIVLSVGGLMLLHSSSDTGSKSNFKSNEKAAVKPTTFRKDFAMIQNELETGAKLYDVRTAEEYGSGHFAGAINWPVEDMGNNNLPDVAKDTKIYVYCRSGVRAGQATEILKTAGFSNVQNLGGLSDVEKLGGELE